MSPPLTPSAAVPRRSQGDRPEESRQSREGQADPSVREDPETQADVDVTPLECVRGEAPRPKAECRDGGGESSGREKPRKASTSRVPSGTRVQHELKPGTKP
jgi:hypothetical protein